MSVENMSVFELKDRLEKGEKLRLIDVREENEWNEAHIAQASLMPLSEFKNHIDKLTDKEETIVLQCRSGKRSMTAALMLAENGHKNLFNLEGGILSWIQSGYDVES